MIYYFVLQKIALGPKTQTKLNKVPKNNDIQEQALEHTMKVA